jgi:hypothetical protein
MLRHRTPVPILFFLKPITMMMSQIEHKTGLYAVQVLSAVAV